MRPWYVCDGIDLNRQLISVVQVRCFNAVCRASDCSCRLCCVFEGVVYSSLVGRDSMVHVFVCQPCHREVRELDKNAKFWRDCHSVNVLECLCVSVCHGHLLALGRLHLRLCC
jgi:hypothetical protein